MTPLLLITLAVGAEPALPAWNDDFHAAAKHAALAPEGLAKHLRYVTDYTSEGMKAEDLEKRRRAQNFAVNLTSREAVLRKLVPIGQTCYVVDLRDFGWSAKIWENLARADPYFHRFVETKGETTRRVKKRFGRPDAQGRMQFVEERWVEEKVAGPASAKAVTGRGIDHEAISSLIKCTGSEAPIVRLDWLIWMQSGQVERAGAGYYDFLGVERSLAKVEELVALDRKKAEAFRALLAVLLQKSGVLADERERAVLRIDKVGGDWWESQDTFRRGTTIEERRKLALTNIDKNYEPDAFEIFTKLPNGLYGTFAADNKGVLQDFVPNNIAGDHFGTKNDFVIEPNMKCLRCHTEGLQPLDDYARRYFRKEKWKHHNQKERAELEAKFLRPFIGKLKADVAEYLETVKQFGFKDIAECHSEYARIVDEYWHAKLGPDEIARELGVPKEVLIKGIRRTDGLWGKLPAPPISRRGFEVRFDLYLEALGYK